MLTEVGASGALGWVASMEGQWDGISTWVWVRGFSPGVLGHQSFTCDTINRKKCNRELLFFFFVENLNSKYPFHNKIINLKC